MPSKATARKTRHGYKPVIDHGWRTEVIGTRYRLSEDGRDMVLHKGAAVYANRADAIAHAQRTIDLRGRVKTLRHEQDTKARASAVDPCPDAAA